MGDSVETSEGTAKPRGPSLFDLMSKLVLPVVLVIVAQLQSQRTRFWVLMAFAIVAFVASFIRPWEIVARVVAKVKTKGAFRRALPEFLSLARRFGEFVDTRRSDTLHYYAFNDLCGGNASVYAKLAIPPAELWNEFGGYFVQRVERERPRISEFLLWLQEFYHLVGSYNNLCVAPVFQNLPLDMQSALTQKARSSLNSFQQRFDHFLSNYEEFSAELAASRPMFRDLPRYLAHPKPH